MGWQGADRRSETLGMQHPAGMVGRQVRNRADGIGDGGKNPSGPPNFLSRTMGGHVTVWPAGMERRYGFTAEQAVGRVSHQLLRSVFPLPLADIEATMLRDNSWHGGLIHHRADGRAVLVISHWHLHRHGSGPDDTIVTETHAAANSIEMAHLFAIMANELSQPLTAIANYVSGARRSLQRDAPEAETARKAMTLAAVQIERGTAQVQLMRSLAEDLRNVG
jgi:signal transduction histidine kinase